jgi:hypothetical protein
VPFNHLLVESLQPGTTLAEDRKSGCRSSADLKPGKSETVLLFHLDADSTRKHLKLSQVKCCDHLYLFKSSKGTSLIFVELKSTNLDGADQQILNAFEAICQHPNFNARSVRVLAVIVSSGSVFRDPKKIRANLRKRGIELHFGTSRDGHPCLIKEVIRDLSV